MVQAGVRKIFYFPAEKWEMELPEGHPEALSAAEVERKNKNRRAVARLVANNPIAQHLDYPQAGADDSVEDEELKYDYILHSDECSPMLHDCGITRVVTVPQLPKSPDDPARLRGLTYDKVGRLMDEVIVFNV
ncbi:hypothetical protein HDU96_001870 [Phlyctochytrium bullatum]|nr:hypothetical protein HDU96_001870 [Phlyctochytrium bullatum]